MLNSVYTITLVVDYLRTIICISPSVTYTTV